MAGASPNEGHRAVAALEHAGLVTGLVTQNVDGLHTAAGSPDPLELHGALSRVVCLTCGELTGRDELAVRLDAANRDWHAQVLGVHPDGDVDLAEDELEGFTPVPCARCGGVLKPDVVFFGETVPRHRVDAAFAMVDTCAALLVLGSSLTVMSGYRFVLRAAKLGTPVAIVNQGPTRGDAAAAVRVDAPLGQVLPELARLLASQAFHSAVRSGDACASSPRMPSASATAP
jgi:NAD-dependent SIR2 family protein deacetylase